MKISGRQAKSLSILLESYENSATVELSLQKTSSILTVSTAYGVKCAVIDTYGKITVVTNG